MPAPALVAPATHHDAQPRIGLALGTALYVASVLGTGILLLPTLAARAAGPASLVAVAAVLLASVPLAAASPPSPPGTPTPAASPPTSGSPSVRPRPA